MALICHAKKRRFHDGEFDKDACEGFVERANVCLSILTAGQLAADEEAASFELGLALEKHGEWRLAWDIFFGLVEHFGTNIVNVSDTHAHAAVRCASLVCRVQGRVPSSKIPRLCSHLRVCFIGALGQRKLCQKLPSPRKLLEWMVHVTVPLNSGSCAKECWQEVQQAVEQGGDQAIRVLMDQRSAEEQTQLLRLLGHHARNVQPEAADAVAVVLQRLLAPLAQGNEQTLQEAFSKPNDAAVWLKTIATTLEALTVHLPYSSQQMSLHMDWADKFVTNLGRAVAGIPKTSGLLQPLHSLILRGRLRALEAFRKSNPHLDISRPEIFHAWKKPLLQQFGSLVTGGEILDGCEEVPAKLQPFFQLCGLTSALTLPWQRLQALESLRLQLPPGPISAILALCQLQLHYTAFTGNVTLENYDIGKGVSHCASFGRLVISLVTDPDFRRALDAEGSLGSSLALQSIRVQLQRCTPSMPSELGRLRLLQAQASALQARIDDAADPEDCQQLITLALDDWAKSLGLETDQRTPCSLIKALEASGIDRGYDHLLQRDLSDAAYLSEMLDLHALSMRLLALCLAATLRQHGRKALLWLQDAKQSLPKSACEVYVVLLYRLAAASGRLDGEHGQDSQVSVSKAWWQLAEARKATLEHVPPLVLTQRMSALCAMPEGSVLTLWQSGGCSWEAFSLEQGQPEDGLMFAEAFWSCSQWSAHWQDLRCGQCPGGSAISSQTAALRSMKLLFHGPKVYPQQSLQQVPTEAHAPELLRWPVWRSGLLQLRVIHQVSLSYDRLGEADLAVACADSGLELMERKLCGDLRWKLRFLCIRTRCRCASLCHFDFTKEEKALRQIEDLWNRRIRGRPHVELMSKEDEAELSDFSSSTPSIPLELLTLWVKTCPKGEEDKLLRFLSQVSEARLPSERLVLLIQLQMENPNTDQWNRTAQQILDGVCSHPPNAPFPRPLCQALALLAQALFSQLSATSSVKHEWSLRKVASDLEQCCDALSLPAERLVTASKPWDTQAMPDLGCFFQVCAAALRGALFMGESALARQCSHMLLRMVDAAKASTDSKVPEERTSSRSRSRSPSRESGEVIFARAQWRLCKQVVPCSSGASLLFITELRAMQRRLEKMGHCRALECFANPDLSSMHGVVAVEDICSGNWMSQLSADISMAWLQVDWTSHSLQITRSVDGTRFAAHSKVLSERVSLRSEVLQSLQDELQSLHRSNTDKIKELWQRKDKTSEAARLEFWRSRKGFDEELGKLLEKIQKEVLSVGRFLLAPWPRSEVAQQRVLNAVRQWLNNEAKLLAEHLRLGNDCEQNQHLFLLALLMIEAEHMEVGDVLFALKQLWDGGSRCTLRRLAYSIRRYSSDLKQGETSELPLLLYLDGFMAQLPIEACPCLRQRNIVRGLAPSITLAALASRSTWSEKTGFFVIDPAEDCAAMGDVRQLLTTWSSQGQAWHGHTGQLPEPSRVLEELCRKDVFVYLGHGERARQLLRHEKLQIAGVTEDDRRVAGLRSILMLLGCSSVKIQRCSAQGDGPESFGLASSALLGGAPLVLGAQWDVLGGDLDKFASRLLQRWLKEGKTCPPSGGLLAALKELRPKCLLPNLTGAALVCYGIPV